MYLLFLSLILSSLRTSPMYMIRSHISIFLAEDGAHICSNVICWSCCSSCIDTVGEGLDVWGESLTVATPSTEQLKSWNPCKTACSLFITSTFRGRKCTSKTNVQLPAVFYPQHLTVSTLDPQFSENCTDCSGLCLVWHVASFYSLKVTSSGSVLYAGCFR